MSHTNSTTNYSLPQFVGTDKPAWLTDVNGAFSAIDTQMKSNADAATTAGSDATAANTAIGTIANLNTTDKTSLVNAVNEVNTNLSTVSGVASGASTTATQAKNTADDLVATFTLSNTGTATVTTNNGSINYQRMYYASNAAGSVGKIYGEVGVTPTTNTTTTLRFTTPFRPTEALTIGGNSIVQAGSNKEIYYIQYNIATNGEVTITLPNTFYNMTSKVILTASLTFFVPFAEN